MKKLSRKLVKPVKTSDILKVIIEIPKGSRNKYEYDQKEKRIKLDRMLFSSMHYPSDYGFIPHTLGGDNDPLDVLVLVTEATFPGCMIEVRPIGLFKMRDEKGSDEKILSVPINDPEWNHIETLKQVSPRLLNEIEHFFTVYKDLEMKKVGVDGWGSLAEAKKVIVQARKRYVESQK